MSQSNFKLLFTKEAHETLSELRKSPSHAVTCKKVRKTLRLISNDPRHPGLHTHKYRTVRDSSGKDLWQSYVESRTPGAWRIWWQYGPGEREITIVAMLHHP